LELADADRKVEIKFEAGFNQVKVGVGADERVVEQWCLVRA
jgi:hypothetical protein